MDRFDGYLFSKLFRIGSRSEGPEYFLQQFDYKIFAIIKKAAPWMPDEALHKFLGHKVTIKGDMTYSGIRFAEIRNYQPGPAEPKEKRLEVDLKLDADTLWIDKKPSPPHPTQHTELALMVNWPFRSIWEGECPSTQIYEFFIEVKDAIIWKWSQNRVFAQVNTPVIIPGGSWHEFSEIWKINPDDIESEGTYTARALFIASGQEVSREFEIKFAS